MTPAERLHIWRGRAERAEARVAGLEQERQDIRAEGIRYSDQLEADWKTRLHQATEALREAERIATESVDVLLSESKQLRMRRNRMLAVIRSALAALAGEDEKPPEPQREGDYL